MRGDDLRFDLTIDFEDAIFGTEKEIKIRRLEACDTCKGTGSASGRGPSVCPQCQGRGQIRYQQGFFSVARTCSACGGTRIDHQRSLPDVPRRNAGDQGDQAQRQGSAGCGRGNAHSLRGRRRCGPRAARRAATFTSCFRSAAHDFFEREGQNLHCVIPISFPQAALGADIEIPGVDGPVMLKIPEGTQSGKELRIRGQGCSVPE